MSVSQINVRDSFFVGLKYSMAREGGITLFINNKGGGQMKKPHPYPVVPASNAGDFAQQTVLLIFKAKKGPQPSTFTQKC